MSSVTSKICRKCQKDKVLSEFTRLTRNKDGLHENCRVCKRKSEYDYFHANEHARTKRRINNRLYKYDLNVEDFKSLLDKQNNSCAICTIPFDGSTYNHIARIDHNHSTNKVRGLLCQQCNLGLGHFFDNNENLTRAADYLKVNN